MTVSRDEIDLDLAEATGAARQLAAAGEQLLGLQETAGADLQSRNDAQPWGRDELGDAFARGYGESAAQVLEIWRSLAQRTCQLGDDIAGATEAALEADRITSEVIDNVR